MPSFKLDPSLLMNEVYSYPFPEVRALLGGLQLDERFMLNTVPAQVAGEHLAPYRFAPALELPTRVDGTLDLDELHITVLDRVRAVLASRLAGIDGYANRYPVAGSSPAIFHLLAEWKATGALTHLATLEGDYDGYRALASTLAIPTRTYASLDDARPLAGETWFVSNPSARDGCWFDPEQWMRFVGSGCRIVLDVAYVGLTADAVRLDVSSTNIVAVLTSPSKVFGVFRHRYTGTTFTREPVASLYGTKWFKDIRALLDTLALYETFATDVIPNRYKPWQHTICEAVTAYAGVRVQPCDTILLGWTTEHVPEELARYRRGGVVRFGLTKLYEDYERQASTG